MSRKVVWESTEDLTVRYEIEYRDGQGEWVGAAGAWQELTIPSQYINKSVAVSDARKLREKFEWPTRILEVREVNDVQ